MSGFGAVRNIPPEAIAKVEIFPEEVALQYGYSATERVVNFVLKPDFRQVSAEAEAGVPTQGGQFKSELEPSFIAIGANGRSSAEHTSELQSLMRISYAVFCLKKKHSTTECISDDLKQMVTHTKLTQYKI